jgi:hypothetical protein
MEIETATLEIVQTEELQPACHQLELLDLEEVLPTCHQ